MPYGVYDSSSSMNRPMVSTAKASPSQWQQSEDYWGGGGGGGWSSYAPAIAQGVAGLGQGIAGLYQNQRMYDMLQAMNKPLPFTADLSRGVQDLGGLIDELKTKAPPALLLASSTNAARQAAAAHGVTGPLAASIETGASQNAASQFDQWRRQQLMQALGQRQTMAEQLAAQELANRMRLAQQRAAYLRNADGPWGLLWDGMATGGSIFASAYGGPAAGMGVQAAHGAAKNAYEGSQYGGY